jgi:hypothetical protein
MPELNRWGPLPGWSVWVDFPDPYAAYPPDSGGRHTAQAELRRSHPPPEPWFASNPPPSPWAVRFLVSAVTTKVAAANMANKAAAQQVVAAADASIASFIDGDDICPPWPFPGPPPWLGVIASELTLIANTLQEGALQAGLLQVAGLVLDRHGGRPPPPSTAAP